MENFIFVTGLNGFGKFCPNEYADGVSVDIGFIKVEPPFVVLKILPQPIVHPVYALTKYTDHKDEFEPFV
jgi:hypothetical protein